MLSSPRAPSLPTPADLPLAAPLGRALAVLFGGAYALLVLHGLEAPVRALAPLRPVRLHLRAGPTPPEPPTAAAAAPRPLDLPEATPAPRPHGQNTRPGEQEASGSRLTPGPVGPAPPAGGQTAPAPPGPATLPEHLEQLQGRVYPETDGGDTLVLAVLIDSDGRVISHKVMVHSNDPLSDLNYQLMLPGLKLTTPNPPLAAGDTRWMDFRVRYAPETTADLP